MIEVYCDGSCPKPDGPGGWAWIIVADGREYEGSGGVMSTTNNKMEMQAAIEALAYLVKNGYEGETVKLTSDSQYVIKGLNEWGWNWKKNGWRRKDRDGQWVKVANEAQWKELFFLAHDSFRISFEWVRGHNGHDYNERCDKLAGEATASMRER